MKKEICEGPTLPGQVLHRIICHGEPEGLQLPPATWFKQEEPAAALEDDETLSAQLNQAPVFSKGQRRLRN